MAQQYRTETELKKERQIDELLRRCPGYIKDYFGHLGTKIRPSTRLNYLQDTIEYMEYQKSAIPDVRVTGLANLPIGALSHINAKDIDEYMAHLKKKKNSPGTIKRKLASLSRLYKYFTREEIIEKNPLAAVDRPRSDSHDIIWLSAKQTDDLLSGILRNDKMLVTKKQTVLSRKENKESYRTEKEVVNISPLAKIKREPVVSRNYAIVMLFLGTGIRISELVGIDLDDINMEERRINIIRKRGKHEHIFFGQEVKDALSAYINGNGGQMTPPIYDGDKDVHAFCEAYKTDPGIQKRAAKYFETTNETFLKEVARYAAFLRGQGRTGLRPQKGENALFISSRGSRITPRMVELMIKEMVYCYIPDCENKDKISPHKLRSTCATRLLAQTDDIMAVSEQLGHDSITTTSRHYAQLQKDRSLRKTSDLPVTGSW